MVFPALPRGPAGGADMTGIAPDLAPGLASAFTASLATRSHRDMLALEIRMAEHWAADAALAEVRRARINQLGVPNRSGAQRSIDRLVHVRASTRIRIHTIIDYLRHNASVTTKQAAAVAKMSPDYARIMLNGMMDAGTLTRTQIMGQVSIYSLAEPAPQQMKNGVTP